MVASADALIVVDVQNDFLPGGSLPVPHGDEVVPVLNRYLRWAEHAGLPVIATRDWHPSDHCSFRSQGGPWPEHCVAGSAGAAFVTGLALPSSTVVVDKATYRDREDYSGFESSDFDHVLRSRQVRRLLVGGLATDYCILYTVVDSLARGYEVALLEDAVRAVDVNPGDGDRAKAEMLRCGAIAMRFAMVT